MSQIKRTVVERKMFTIIRQNAIRAARALLAAAIVLAILAFAGHSGCNLIGPMGRANLWSDLPPAATGRRRTRRPSARNNDFSSPAPGRPRRRGPLLTSLTPRTTPGVWTLWYQQEGPNYHTTQINSGITLKIVGNARTNNPSGNAGNYSLIAGVTDGPGTDTISRTTITGTEVHWISQTPPAPVQAATFSSARLPLPSGCTTPYSICRA